MKAIIYTERSKPLFYGGIVECIKKRNEIEPSIYKPHEFKIIEVKGLRNKVINLI
jgi:hypothetical protein